MMLGVPYAGMMQYMPMPCNAAFVTGIYTCMRCTLAALQFCMQCCTRALVYAEMLSERP